MAQQPTHQIIQVPHSSDVSAARRAAREMAKALGFDEKTSEEIAIATSELASNLFKHAKGGEITLMPLTETERKGIQIESTDSGPGIADIEQAMSDGFSAAGSLGYGLGAVNRLMDELDITSRQGEGGGTRIACKRWVRVETPSRMPCPFEFGAATRAHLKMAVNGDAFVIKRWGESALVGVIDGLGHGQFAHRAGQAARQYVESHHDQPLEAIFRGVGRVCRATRGVVMALARFDWAQARLSFAGVGNVEARVFGSPEPMNFSIHRGVIGLNAPHPVVAEYRWQPNFVMVLYSDGLTAPWRWEDFSHLADQSAPLMAQRLLHALAKEDDDATVVVVKGQ